jgi:DinB family protein
VAGTPLTREQVLALLTETPLRIGALTAGLEREQLRTAPGPDEWSINDVVAHLRACSDVWGNHIRAIVAQDKPTLRAVNPRTWIKSTDYPELEFRPSFRSFVKQRADLVALLEPLPPRDWARLATVEGWGQAYEHTVLFYGQKLAGHERTHIKQVARIAAGLTR